MKKVKNNLLIILSAKIVENNLKKIFGNITPVLLPYENDKVIHHFLKEYTKLYDPLLLTKKGIDFDTCDFLKNKYPNFHIEVIENSISLIDTMKIGLENLDLIDYTNISIIFGDSFFSINEIEKYLNTNFFFISDVYKTKKWTIYFNDKFYDKNMLFSFHKKKAVAGFFNFTNSNLLKESINHSVDFYDCLSYYKDHEELNPIESKTWLDFGHLKNYYQTKKNASRYFNQIEIDYKSKTLKKSSSNIDKLYDEINWYIKLPRKFKYLIPKIYFNKTNFSKDSRINITMKYYELETIHDIYVHSNHNISYWIIISKLLFKTLKAFENYKKLADTKKVIKSNKLMILEKPLIRLEELKKDVTFTIFFENKFHINNFQYDSINDTIKELREEYFKLDFSDSHKYYSLIHGDYFFANILIDVSRKKLKLLDPRGSYNEKGCFGDIRYDYAKLLHSVNGKYDLIVEDLFSLRQVTNCLFYTFHETSSQKILNELIKKEIDKRVDKRIIMFYEITLFFSMITLHKDKPDRQMMMLIRAMELFREYKGEFYGKK